MRMRDHRTALGRTGVSVRMSEGNGYLAERAPFLLNYWPYILGGVLSLALAGVLAYFLAPPAPEQRADDKNKPKESAKGEREGEKKKKKAEKDPKAIVSIDKGEHPLEEFDDERPDPALAPPQHDANLPHVPYPFTRVSEEEMKGRAAAFYQQMDTRRSVRHFSSDPVPQEAIENIVLASGTSPSGAHSEPWTFVVVKDAEIKKRVREIVEQEEYLNYDRRMGDRWVRDIKFVQTTHEKPYLETAPYLIVVFKQAYHVGGDGTRYAHYYFEISTAIACGMLVAAIHNAGLVTVTTTPLNAGI